MAMTWAGPDATQVEHANSGQGALAGVRSASSGVQGGVGSPALFDAHGMRRNANSLYLTPCLARCQVRIRQNLLHTRHRARRHADLLQARHDLLRAVVEKPGQDRLVEGVLVLAQAEVVSEA
jgi:hypothetical protein